MKNIIQILKEPLFNAIFSGLLIYLLITISNKGNPILGAIMSSLPIGIFGLIAIVQKNHIQNFYIRSEIFTNLIIIIMWISVNILLNYTKNIYFLCIIGLMIWVILSLLFYHIAKKYMPNR